MKNPIKEKVFKTVINHLLQQKVRSFSKSANASGFNFILSYDGILYEQTLRKIKIIDTDVIDIHDKTYIKEKVWYSYINRTSKVINIWVS